MENPALFRHHDVAPEGVISPLYRRLTQEWADLHNLPTTRTTTRRWGRREAALAGYSTLGEIVDAIDHAATGEKNQILLALIRLFQDGQQLAGRTVLQAMLPKLTKTSGHVSRWVASTESWDEDRRHIVLAEFWDIMATYPVDRRPTSVASNLALDTLHRVTGVRTSIDIPIDPHELFDINSSGHRANTTSREPDAVDASDLDPGLSPDADLLLVIKWAMDTGTITVDDAQLLAVAYLTARTTGHGYAEAAARFEISQQTARKRCSRIARKITDAVRRQLALDAHLTADAARAS